MTESLSDPSTTEPQVIERTVEDGIALLRMAHGPVSALDTELATALADAVEGVADDPDVRALVLTGTGRVFSAGVDLFRVVDGGAPYLESFLPALDRLLDSLRSSAKPTVAAINGHAIAGGCVLACCCDARLVTDLDTTIGVPELAVGVPFPNAALDPVRRLVPPRYHTEVILLGRRFAPDAAVERGLADRVVAHDTLQSEAAALARELGAIRPACYEVTKRQLSEDPAGPDLSPRIRELWSDARTHADIRSYLDRTLGWRAEEGET